VERAHSVVIRGLDPRIHPSSQSIFQRGWIAGSSPAMTELRWVTAPPPSPFGLPRMRLTNPPYALEWLIEAEAARLEGKK
jgi:hypothetical protein